MIVALTVGQSWLLFIAVLLTIVAFTAVVFAVADAISRRVRADRRAKGQEIEVMPDREFQIRTKNGAAPQQRPAPRPQRK